MCGCVVCTGVFWGGGLFGLVVGPVVGDLWLETCGWRPVTCGGWKPVVVKYLSPLVTCGSLIPVVLGDLLGMYITSSASSAGSGVSGRTRAMLARDENDLMLGTSNPQDLNCIYGPRLTISSSAYRLQAQYELDTCALDACPPPCFAKHSACCKPAPLLAYLLAEHHLFLNAVKAHPKPKHHPNVAMVGPVSSGRRVYRHRLRSHLAIHEHLMRQRGSAYIELTFSMIEGHKKQFIAMEERVYAFSIKMSGNDPQRLRSHYWRAIPLAINDLIKWASAEVTAEAK